jgi:hypothetical protein
VVLSLGWFLPPMFLPGLPWAPARIGERVFQLVGLPIFVAWVVVLVWAWKISTDADHLRRQLGIEPRRRSETSNKDREPPRPSEQR